MRFGIISTGKISGEFAQAIENTEGAEISAVCSRTLESAQNFVKKFQLPAQSFDDVDELCASAEVDVVYIASPNSHHLSHALSAIDAGKHVVVEKPAVWNQAQWDQLWGEAQKRDVLVLEAARHIFEPAQSVIRDYLVGKKPQAVTMNFSQYSSRWEAVQNGEVPNIFSLKTGGGVVVDMGVYPIYDAVYWFGEPDAVNYFPVLAPTGVDAAGTLVLVYKDFNVTINIAKTGFSDAPSEILFGHETLRLSSVQGIDLVTEYSAESSQVLFDSGAEQGSRSLAELMEYELKIFVQMIQAHQNGAFDEALTNRYRSLTLLSRAVNDVCTKARYSAGIFFEGETLQY